MKLNKAKNDLFWWCDRKKHERANFKTGIDKIYLYTKDLCEAKRQLLSNK